MNFNHTSDKLTDEEITKFKNLYKNYHRLQMCYKWKYKNLQMGSISLTATCAIAGSVTLNPIVLGCLTGSGFLIQGYITKSNLSNKVQKCKFAYTSYEKICVQLKMFLRGVPCDQKSFLTDLKVLDDIVIDQCPTIDHYVKKYNKKFIG